MSGAKRVSIILVMILFLSAIAFVLFPLIRPYINYGVEFTLNDNLPEGEGKRATVILLGGQSNASGCSRDDYLQKNVSEEKYNEYKSGYDNVYINYFSSGTNESRGFVKCGAMQGEGGGFFGPELGLAEKLHETYPDEQFFIIKYAWGGTNLFDQWRAPSSKGPTGEIYKAFVSFVEESMGYLIQKNYDVKIEGMCWMQGESDSFSEDNGRDYETNLSDFVKDIRRRFSRYASDDGIAFVDALIADNPVFWVYCDLVNASKRAVAASSPINALIDTNAAGLICTEEPTEQPDIPHYDSLSEIKLGHLFAEEIITFFD